MPLSLRARRGRPAIALSPADALQIDAIQEHGQVGSADLDAAVTARGRELEAALFEPLVVDDEAVGVPKEQLEAVGDLVAKDEEMAGERIAGQAVADERCQGVEALAHVGGLSAQEDTHGRRQAQHAGISSATARSCRSMVGSKLAGTRRHRPLASTMSMAGGEAGATSGAVGSTS